MVIRPHQDFRGFAGTVASGTTAPGEEISVLPSGKQSRVRSIVTYDGELASVRRRRDHYAGRRDRHQPGRHDRAAAQYTARRRAGVHPLLDERNAHEPHRRLSAPAYNAAGAGVHHGSHLPHRCGHAAPGAGDGAGAQRDWTA